MRSNERRYPYQRRRPCPSLWRAQRRSGLRLHAFFRGRLPRQCAARVRLLLHAVHVRVRWRKSSREAAAVPPEQPLQPCLLPPPGPGGKETRDGVDQEAPSLVICIHCTNTRCPFVYFALFVCLQSFTSLTFNGARWEQLYTYDCGVAAHVVSPVLHPAAICLSLHCTCISFSCLPSDSCVSVCQTSITTFAPSLSSPSRCSSLRRLASPRKSAWR